LFSNKTASHAFISHKERNKDLDCLLYPNDRVTELVDIKLYEFLDDHGHQDQLEDKFKRKYFNLLNYSFCEQHHCHKEIINKCILVLEVSIILVVYNVIQSIRGTFSKFPRKTFPNW
jgi:hypothetical protein